MAVNIPRIARQLFEFAAEIATHDRPVDGVQWYQETWSPDGNRSTPIVPRAIHDALCPKLSVRLEDPAKEIVVCDRCGLAVEDGAS